MRTGKHKDVTAPLEGVVKSIVAPNACEECIEVKKPWLINLQHWHDPNYIGPCGEGSMPFLRPKGGCSRVFPEKRLRQGGQRAPQLLETSGCAGPMEGLGGGSG